MLKTTANRFQEHEHSNFIEGIGATWPREQNRPGRGKNSMMSIR
jgi:hypothetical protein